VTEVFGPTVPDYHREKDLPLKVLLVIENALAHPPNLMEELPDEFSFIKVHFLPPNATPLLQCMASKCSQILKNSTIRHCSGNVLRPILPVM
jgi:hypothetical protein